MTKVDVIRHNAHKYSISAMSKVLGIARSTYYYEAKKKTTSDRKLNETIIRIFKASRNIYGTRKIKVELKKED